jgi:hypothetical protein
MSGIQLRCKIFPGAFLLYLCKPRFSIDGSPEQICTWGENPIGVPPGRHHLRVWFKYITGPTNVADLVLDIPPGQPVRVVYKSRWLVFLPGKIAIEGAASGAYAGAAGAVGQPVGGPMPGGPMPGEAPAAVPAAAATPAGWNPDPSGRHQHRWWDGTRWTPAVADNGVTSDDPI